VRPFAFRNNCPNVLPLTLFVSEKREAEKRVVPFYLWNSWTDEMRLLLIIFPCFYLTSCRLTPYDMHTVQMITDSLSLAMFEALRGLRDAVAPESGNLGAQTNTNNDNNDDTTEPDADELWHAYKAGDLEVVRMVQTSQRNSGSTLKLTSREDFIRWHAKMEMEKDTELVMQLASTVLDKSAEIDRQVDEDMPGMNRTRAQQMEYLEQLITENREAASALQEAYETAREKRDSCRQFIKDKTSEALGIEEESDAQMK
jgi:hypothetical protein